MMSRTAKLWTWTAVAVGALALVPIVNFLTIYELDRLHRQALATQAPRFSAFGFGPAAVPQTVPPRTAVGSGSTASSGGLRTRADMPALAAPTLPPSEHQVPAQLLALPPLYWHSPAILLGLGGTIVLLGLSIGSVLHIARQAVRPAGPSAVGPEQPHAGLRRLADQARRDTSDVVHAMRTPLSIIMGHTASLRRQLPKGNARLDRSLQAIELSASDLNGSLDEAWERASSLLAFSRAPREAVDLCEAVLSACPGATTICRGKRPTTCRVMVPRQWLQEAVEGIADSFEQDVRLVVAFETDGSTVGFRMSAAGNGQVYSPDLNSLRPWPALVDASRTIHLMGGTMAVTASAADAPSLREVSVTLPRIDRMSA